MAAEAAGRRNPQPFFTNEGGPAGDTLAQFLHRLDVVAPLIDNASRQRHALWQLPERFALVPLAVVFDLERRDIDNAIEVSKDLHPGRATQYAADRPPFQIPVA